MLAATQAAYVYRGRCCAICCHHCRSVGFVVCTDLPPPPPFPSVHFSFLPHTAQIYGIVGPSRKCIFLGPSLKQVIAESAAHLRATNAAPHLSYRKVAHEVRDRNGFAYNNLTPQMVKTAVRCIAPVSPTVPDGANPAGVHPEAQCCAMRPSRGICCVQRTSCRTQWKVW